VLHSGQVRRDKAGVAGPALNFAFRLLAAPMAKQRLRESAGILAVIASEQFYQDVITQQPAAVPTSYQQIRAEFDGFSSGAWLRLLGQFSEPATQAPELLGQFSDVEMDRVRGWLADVKEPIFADIARRAAGAALPLPRFDDPWHAFARLADVNAGPDGVPPGLLFLDALATEVGGDLVGVLTSWVDEKVRQLDIGPEFQEGRRLMSRVVDEPQLRLLIALEPDGIDQRRHVLSAWRQDDPEVWPPPRTEIRDIDLDHIEQVLDDVVVAAERAWAGQRATVTLEFLLPRELVHLPVHRFSKEHESGQPQPLCLDYIIRLRSLDRLKATHWHRAWRERWRSLQSNPSPARIHFADTKDDTMRIDVALRERDSVAMVLDAPPAPRPADSKIDYFTAAMRSGLPIMFWHPNATLEELGEFIGWLVASGSLIDLPERTKKSRMSALGSSPLPFDSNLARDLVVLWDDPEHIVVLGYPPNTSW
jgi:hypothetical protein